MRISEVEEGSILRRRNVPDAYNEYASDEEYVTDEEYEDYDIEEEEEADRNHQGRNSFASRLAAIVPSRLTRSLKLSSTSLVEKSKAVAKTTGNLAWIVTTSLILLGVPVLYAYDREKNMAAQSGQMAPLDEHLA